MTTKQLTKADILNEPIDLINEMEVVLAASPPVTSKWKSAEKMVHTTAFEYYYGLGDKRSATKVAEYMKLNPDTIKTWSYKFKWVDRVHERDLLRSDVNVVHMPKEIADVKKALADYLGRELQAVINYNKDGTVKSVTGPKLKSIKELDAGLTVYYRVTGEKAREDAAAAAALQNNNGNGVNIQFIIKGRT